MGCLWSRNRTSNRASKYRVEVHLSTICSFHIVSRSFSGIQSAQATPPEDKSAKTIFSWDKTERADITEFTYQNLTDESKVKPPGSVQYLQNSCNSISIFVDTAWYFVKVYTGSAVCYRELSGTPSIRDSGLLVHTYVITAGRLVTCALVTAGLQHLSV